MQKEQSIMITDYRKMLLSNSSVRVLIMSSDKYQLKVIHYTNPVLSHMAEDSFKGVQREKMFVSSLNKAVEISILPSFYHVKPLQDWLQLLTALLHGSPQPYCSVENVHILR